MRPVLAVLPTVMLLSCGAKSGACDTADTGCFAETGNIDGQYTGDAEIDQVSWDCNNDWYWYDVWTFGWTSGGVIDIHETGSSDPWTESHTLGSIEWDESGAETWEHLYVELRVLQEPECSRDGGSDPCYEQQIGGVNTLFLCDASFYDSTMTWSATIWDDESGAYDCVAWGDQPSYYSGCTAL